MTRGMMGGGVERSMGRGRMDRSQALALRGRMGGGLMPMMTHGTCVAQIKNSKTHAKKVYIGV
jgi:hypothetical protein